MNDHSETLCKFSLVYKIAYFCNLKEFFFFFLKKISLDVQWHWVSFTIFAAHWTSVTEILDFWSSGASTASPVRLPKFCSDASRNQTRIGVKSGHRKLARTI